MRKTLAILLVAALFLSAHMAHAEQKPLRVTTSFYPLYIFTQNVLKDVPGVELVNLTHPSTGCLHDYQLLASDMRTLSQADMLVINGGGMEGFLDNVIVQFPGLKLVDSSTGIELIPEAVLPGRDGDAHDHADEEAHEDEEHADGEAPEDHAGHDHGEYNAHIWLDPQNAQAMTLTIADALSRQIPEYAELIKVNAQDFVDRLGQLHEELLLSLSELKRHDIVTFHEAFPYFAKAYGLQVVAVVALEPDEALSPAMLSALVDTVRAHNLPPLFTEPQYEDRAARAVAQETGAQIYELDPIVTGDGAPDAYERGMRRNAQALIEALGSEE